MDDAELLERAIALACCAHRGQRYPSPEVEPYIQHPLRVMLAVQGLRTQMAAVLHDVLEDTDVEVQQLRDADIPENVLDAVIALTYRAELTYEQYIDRVAGNAIARRVKLADLTDNLANNRRLARTPETAARIERYEQARDRLSGDDSAVPAEDPMSDESPSNRALP